MIKKIKKEGLENVFSPEQTVEFLEKEKIEKEKIEDLSVEEIKKIREEIEKTDLDDSLKLQTQNHAQDIKYLEEDKKIKKLLALANKKGAVYAIGVAKNIDDPYLLDKFHDVLVEKGYYKSFLKKT